MLAALSCPPIFDIEKRERQTCIYRLHTLGAYAYVPLPTYTTYLPRGRYSAAGRVDLACFIYHETGSIMPADRRARDNPNIKTDSGDDERGS